MENEKHHLLLMAVDGTEGHTHRKHTTVMFYPLAAEADLCALTVTPPPAAGALGLPYCLGQSWVGQPGT